MKKNRKSVKISPSYHPIFQSSFFETQWKGWDSRLYRNCSVGYLFDTSCFDGQQLFYDLIDGQLMLSDAQSFRFRLSRPRRRNRSHYYPPTVAEEYLTHDRDQRATYTQLGDVVRVTSAVISMGLRVGMPFPLLTSCHNARERRSHC